MRVSSLLAALGALTVLAAHAAAQHSGDVIVDVVDGQVITGKVNSSGGLVFPWRVWSENFGSGGFPNFTSDPGYDSLAGTFIPGTPVGIAIRKALRVWDVNEEHFLMIAEPETMEVSRVGVIIQTPPADPQPGDPLPTLTLGQANSSGLIHAHPGYHLTEPHGQGVYLLELAFWVDSAGVEPSDPFWIVFNQNESPATVAAAIAWVEDNLVGTPCPGDLNGDGVVDVSDLLILLGAWGPCPSSGDCPADLNGDGVVDVSDLLILLGAWGQCP